MKHSPNNIIKRFVALLKSNRVKVLLFCLVLTIGFVVVWRIKQQADSTLAHERERMKREGLIPHEKRSRLPLDAKSIKHINNTNVTKAVVRFGDAYYAATESGLVRYSSSGKIEHTYTTIDGLTENDITSIATFQSKIFIGTRTGDLLSFDGEHFESFHLADRDVKTITALFEDKNRLLIGTFAGGFVEFDGNNFKELKRINAITHISRDGAKLYIGTFADGLWIEETGSWFHFTKSNGLPSNRVVGVVNKDDELFVATDFGLASTHFENLKTESPNAFRTIATLPTLSGLVLRGATLLLCTDDGKISSLEKNALKEIDWNKPNNLSECKFAKSHDELLLTSNQGIWRDTSQNQKLALTSFNQSDKNSLTSNAISALAFDNEGRLWAGSFRNGLDVFDANGRKTNHIETEAAREINSIVVDKKNNSTIVATSQGVLNFDSLFRPTQITKANGLLSNSVQHLVIMPNPPVGAGGTDLRSFAFATSRGFSFGTKEKLRAISTVQGLPNNNTYSVLTIGDKTFVGTLGGLAQIENGKVVRTFKDSNSKLTHNWITALTNIGQRIFIGTYGGGVFEMNANGELRSFANETGKTIVNPNAMWSDGEKLFVGTLNGIWIFDLRTQKWRHIQDELPSQTVLSITGNEHHVFFGTTSGIARIEKKYLCNQ
jgi:ligand-binding sensor domain-containing protein